MLLFWKELVFNPFMQILSSLHFGRNKNIYPTCLLFDWHYSSWNQKLHHFYLFIFLYRHVEVKKSKMKKKKRIGDNGGKCRQYGVLLLLSSMSFLWKRSTFRFQITKTYDKFNVFFGEAFFKIAWKEKFILFRVDFMYHVFTSE